MFGENPKRPIDTSDGSNLYIQSIFLTLQGEGPFVGYPAVFIRLGGCNLACEFCDTEFEKFSSYSMEHILNQVDGLSSGVGEKNTKLVVITGGEPLRQDITKLCNSLLDKGYQVQLETNGTIYRPIASRVNVVCSPKATGGKYYPIRQDLLKDIDAFKFLVSETIKPYTAVPNLGQGAYQIPVYVQPMDEYDQARNLNNQKLAMDIAIKNNYILSLQTHKILDIE